MSRLHDLPGLIQSAPFAGGQSPAYWRRETARRTAYLDALLRASTWVEALIRVHPTLRDGPFLGRSLLAVLAHQDDHPADLKPKARPTRMDRGRHTWPGDSGEMRAGNRPLTSPQPNLQRIPKGRRQRFQWSEAQHKHRTMAVASQLERQARSALLERLAGKTVASRRISPGPPLIDKNLSPGTLAPTLPDSTDHGEWLRESVKREQHTLRQSRSNEQPASRHPWPEQPASSEALSPSISPPTTLDSSSYGEWLGELAERAGHALRQSVFDGQPASGEGLLSSDSPPAPDMDDHQDRQFDPVSRTGHLRLQSLFEEPVSGEAPSLAAQWGRSLNGRTAPVELLAYLAGRRVIGNGRSRPKTQARHGREARLATPSPHPPGTPSQESPASQGGASTRNDDNSRPEQKHKPGQWDSQPSSMPGTTVIADRLFRWPDEPLPAEGAPAADLLPTLEQKRDLGARPATLTRMASTVVAPTLPPLRPPQPPVTVLPQVATAIIRQGAAQDAMAVEGDLSVLAANLKRILDEEARRHGIDV